jgi:hypothetical protein
MMLGMVMTDLGMPEEWREWSKQDSARFNERDFETKVRSFRRDTATPVTPGTLIKMARDTGWTPKGGKPHKALSWDSVIGGKAAKQAAAMQLVEQDEPAIVDATIIDGNSDVRPMFADGHETEELSAFLSELFGPEEIIGYVLDVQEETDENGNVTKYKPGSRGVYSRTSKSIVDALKGGSMENAVGTMDHNAGAWIRLNPLDGKGVGNSNVTEFRYALLESDDMPQGKFAEIVRQLNLPVAALVDSGNKSLHAVVRIEATDIRQYADRVNLLYQRCERNGIKVDKQNKNPSRLMRLPGAWRNGRRQFLAGLSQGAADWEEWEEWYADATDELPDVIRLDTVLGDNLPPLKPALIDGLLRVGHKMLIAGPSKAGKSFALIALCIAFAEGGSWFGFPCRKSKVLYVNLELDGDSCINRFNDVYNAMGIKPASPSPIDIWNLRGMSEPMGKLLPKLVRRAKKSASEVVVIDPIYKIMAGDENSASDMTAFSNLFDALCHQANVSVIYCHHHSKGYQGAKRSIDRSSGSGVFGRDPDAILDLTELDVSDDDRWDFARRMTVEDAAKAVESAGGMDAWNAIPQDVRSVATYALENAEVLVDADTYAALRKRFEARQNAWQGYTAWRVSSTLREFPNIKPIDAWFAWPLFSPDELLRSKSEAGGEGGSQPRKPSGSTEQSGSRKKSRKSKIDEAIEYAVGACADDGVAPTRKNVFDRLQPIDGKKVSIETFRTWTKPSGKACSWMCDTSKTDSGKAGEIVRRNSGKI